VLLELPHYAAVSESGRELVVVRSDDGVSWYDHVTPAPPTDDVVADLLSDNFHGTCAALRSQPVYLLFSDFVSSVFQHPVRGRSLFFFGLGG